ncbi:DUF6756 family protein [Paenibacillus aceris]|uniref:DUF6756 family protein n=1 Tax=Paenibacillus aceris TaxID=869555 RepID=UPI001965F9A1
MTTKVIPELVHLREYYIISKKYEWLLCVNHHDIVFGSGAELVDIMEKIRWYSIVTYRPRGILIRQGDSIFIG